MPTTFPPPSGDPQCALGLMHLEEIAETKRALAFLQQRTEDIHNAQRTQSDETIALSRRVTHAQDTANEALRIADAAKHHVDDVVQSMKRHMDELGKSLTTQGEALQEQGLAIRQQGAAMMGALQELSAHSQMLKGLALEMGQQTNVLEKLDRAEDRRTTKELVLEKVEKDKKESEQLVTAKFQAVSDRTADWTKFSVNLALALLLAIIAATVYIVTTRHSAELHGDVQDAKFHTAAVDYSDRTP